MKTAWVWGLSAGLLGAWLFAGGALYAQTKDQQKEADSLVERIKAAKAAVEGRSESATVKKSTETAPKTEAEREPLIRNPYAALGSGGAIPRQGTYDPLDRYRLELQREQIYDRIREGRTTEEKKKAEDAENKSEAETGLTRGAPEDIVRSQLPDYSLERRYIEQLRGAPQVLGGEQVLGGRMVSEAPANMPKAPGERLQNLLQNREDYGRYEEEMTQRYGQRGALPLRTTTPALLQAQETQRLKRWLEEDYNVRADRSGANYNNLSNAYQGLSSLPPVDKSLEKRDAYVPNSTSFLNPTYRGSIYGLPYSSDPYRSNYALDQSKSTYSSADYFNLNVQQSYADYYRREYGVNNSFVPTSPSRQYEVNTLKQWSADLRRDYGIDVGAGQMSYGDMYRLKTSKPKY